MTMRLCSASRALLCGAALTMLSACSGADMARTLGLAHDSPDEFTVTTRAPLTIPTDTSLPVPQPGAPRPQEPATQLAAEAALAPQIELNNRTGSDTPGQDALVASAGPAAPANIREAVNADAQKLNKSGSISNTLAFWQKKPLPGKVIDPVKEAARLRANGVPTPSPAAVDAAAGP